MSCDHDCKRAAPFPRRLSNRPGLTRIDYRIGDYGLMREHIFGLLDAAPALAAWTQRKADDPGIALVEAAALVGDVLARYQDRYANEAYLRSARWHESVVELVRVLGYRLAPGLGGRARFALAVKGSAPVVVPAGFAISAKLPHAGAAEPKPAIFETETPLLARPALSRFHLYRPRHVPDIVNGMDSFQLDAGSGPTLVAGDRLLLGLAQGTTLSHTQIVVVDKVWEAFGVRHIKTRGRIACLLGASSSSASSLSSVSSVSSVSSISSASSSSGISISSTLSAGQLSAGIAYLPAFSGLLHAGLGLALQVSAPQLRAYKLGATARHFGHSAPPSRIALNEASGRVSEVPVSYDRRLDAAQGDPAGPQLRPRQLPLDGELADFSAGSAVLVELNLASTAGSGSPRKRVLERQISQVDRQSLAWGGSSGASTVLQLDQDLALQEGGSALRWADIRGISVHQVKGEGFRLRAAAQPVPQLQGLAFDFYGEREDALALQDRTLLLALPEGPLAVRVQAVSAQTQAGPGFHRLGLDQALPYARFGHERPGVAVHGNLVWASQGKSESEAVLGDGDARQRFQTFVLPRTPLTWLQDSALSPPRRPQLQLRVASVLWQQVESLFGRGPNEQVYIVRELADGRSAVQFGDGLSGARLPSGVGNVRVQMRSGQGACGLPEGSDKPTAAQRLTGFDALSLLEPAIEGAAPEPAAKARQAAPLLMQSLGRIVSLADFEAEALSLAGVLKARASWQLLDGAPLLMLALLLASGQAADAAAAEQALRRALAARGPARWPLSVRIGELLPVRLALTVATEPTRHPDELRAAIAAALGVLAAEAGAAEPAADESQDEPGLLHWRQRQFGEGLHGSQVLAAVQRVSGVRWLRLDGLQAATDTNPPVPARDGLPQLRAAAHQLLGLRPAGLSLQFVADEAESRP